MRFVGHLDMLKTWERIFRRARLPMTFSQGFAPRPLMSLAVPLPVGLLSESEYLEFRTREPLEELAAKLAPFLPRDIDILGLAMPKADEKSLMSLVRYGDYRVGPLPAEAGQKLERQLPVFLAERAVFMEIKRKKGPKMVDIRPLVKSARLSQHELRLRLALGSRANLRVDTFLSYFSLVATAAPITRQEIFVENEAGLLLTPFQYISGTQGEI